MRPKIDRRRLFSTVATVASTDRSTINAYKAAPLPDRLFARPLDANQTQSRVSTKFLPSTNLSPAQRNASHQCVLFFFATIGRERCEIMRADEFLSSRLQKTNIQR